MPELMQSAATFGFGALMAVLIFVAYERLVREVMEVVRANTKAMEELSTLIHNLSDRVSALERAMDR
ncbi:MAG: hypothetical protein J7M34_12835 [Anaerolineae bacterium]|nr:hypothetical protein [Anaerolineae bacterium]